MKLCRDCKQEKPLSSFYNQATTKDKKGSYCKSCHALRSRKYYKDDPSLLRNRQLKYHYGISLADFNSMSEAQNGQCLICKIKPKKLVVDHCHSSGSVRGLLCGRCNTSLGFLETNLDLLSTMFAYLDK